jgi:hypothetical protein
VQEFHPNGRRNHAFKAHTDEGNKLPPIADSWKEIVDRYRAQWITPGQKATLDAEYNRGIASGKSWREIGEALGQIVKGWERGRQLVSKTRSLDIKWECLKSICPVAPYQACGIGSLGDYCRGHRGPS